VWGDGDRHRLPAHRPGGHEPGHLAFIFNRFYRIGTEVRRNRPGTGLGLFIVKSVVKSHHGTIAAESAGPDRGSTFTLTLPGVLDRPEPEAAA
jgi:signal transduction histidine kinase